MGRSITAEWIPWPSKFTAGHIAECEAAHTLDAAAEWLGEIGVELPACVPMFFAETRKGFRYRYPSCVVSVEIENDADFDGERMVDRSRCVRVEVARG